MPDPNKQPELIGLPEELLICAEDSTISVRDTEEDGPKRFDMVAYTGGQLLLAKYPYPVVVELSGLEIPRQSRPVFKDHKPADIVGHTDTIQAADGCLTATGLVSGTGPAAKEVLDSGKNGFPWQASIGAIPKHIVFVPAGHKIEANGRTFEGPIYVAKKAVLREISFVALGADDHTSARLAATGNLEVLPMEFTQWALDKGFDVEALDEKNVKAIQAMYDAEMAAEQTVTEEVEEPIQAAAVVDPVQDIRLQAAGETRRINAIRKLCGDQHPDIEAKAIEDNWDLKDVEIAVLRESRPSAPAIHAAETAPAGQAIEAALCLANGMDEAIVAQGYDERTMNAALSPELRSFGLHSLVYEVIRAAGEYVRPGRIDNDTIRAAFRADQRLIQASGGFSTVSLSGILGNVANKSMLAAYQAVNGVATQICGSTDANDFKSFTRYRLSGTGTFLKVGPDGELKHAGLAEESYSNQLDTWGRMITLTRQMMINDDMGAFLQIPRLIGRMSALALEEAVFTLLLSNPDDFFSTDNSNYFDGADSALDIDSLSVAEKKFLDQTDAAGKPILVRPAILLTPTGLGTFAGQLYNDTQVNQVPANNKAKPTSNPHAGKFRPEVSPYLNLSSIPGSSSTAWHLLADPNDTPIMEIAYLRGKRLPTIESGETDFNVLGMQWRGYFDFGVAMCDERGGVKSKGAA